MTKLLVALSIGLVAQTAFAAVQYEFRQTSRSDMESMPPTDMSAKAILDGDNSRVDIMAGNAYPPGAYIISTNGSKTLTYVDPTVKQFMDINAASAAASIGTRKISIEHARHDVTVLDDHPIIAGQPTSHYRLIIDYDMTVAFGQIPLKQTIHTQIDKWTTAAFGDVSGSYAPSAIRTGNPQIDEMFDLETSRIKGFALRETLTTITTNNRSRAPGSQLQISPSHTLSREVVVSSIRTTKASPADFVIPVTYRRFDPEAVEKKAPASTMLNLEPVSK